MKENEEAVQPDDEQLVQELNDWFDKESASDECSAKQPGEFTIMEYMKKMNLTVNQAYTRLGKKVRDGELEARMGFVEGARCKLYRIARKH